MSPKQRRIAELAKRSPEMSFTSLAYLMDLNWLYEAYRQTRKDGAAGVDGVVAAEYERDLEGNLQALLGDARAWCSSSRTLKIVSPSASPIFASTSPVGALVSPRIVKANT